MTKQTENKTPGCIYIFAFLIVAYVLFWNKDNGKKEFEREKAIIKWEREQKERRMER